jgi:tetratricopeptide (TPR) repeat protein/transcriptional regulator with XRE-family HTH domain
VRGVVSGKPGSKPYRDKQRERLARLGLHGRQLTEQVVADLMRCGCRPREAWRLAYELTQEEVAARFNQARGDPDIRMRGSRICEYEKWPMGGVRPSVRALKILATIYQTTWDQLVDADDLEAMPAFDRQAFLDISDLRYNDSLTALGTQQNRRQLDATAGDERWPVNRPMTTEKSVAVRTGSPISSVEPLSDRPGDGLPGEVTHFTGRDRPMSELRSLIAKVARHGAVVAIYAIDGMAGVGKTAFARHAAHELTRCFPDGAIWVDLYGYTPGMQPRESSDALQQMLLQLGVPPEAIKADLAQRRDQWRYHIQGRRVLIVLDDALTSDQVLPLLPDTPGCLVLITSRRKLTGLIDAYPLSLDVLQWDEAERLFISLIGDRRCEDRNAVRQILDACGRLPLAIRLIAGRLRHHRDELLAEIAADLADHTAALDTLVAEHLSVRAAFEWSYRLLTGAQRRAFRLLGWHPGPEITLVVIAAVADVSPAEGKQLLHELADHNLIDQLSVAGVPGGPRYRMHDLVRLYARERADAEEPLFEQTAAVDRLAGSYLAITRAADCLLRPYVLRDSDQDSAGTVLGFGDESEARTWLTSERHNLLACARAMSPSAGAADLSSLLADHFRDFGFWYDARCLYGQALTIYRHGADGRGEIGALCGLGQAEWLLGKYGQAREYHAQALALARHLGDQHGQVNALSGLGQAKRRVGEYHRAREYHVQALTLARHLTYRHGEIDALTGLGQVEWVIGDYSQAHEHHSEALPLARHLTYRHGEIDALMGLGHVEWVIGDYSQAHEHHTQALALARHLVDQLREGRALYDLGDIECAMGGYGQAHEHHTQAVVLARHLGDQHGEVEALRGLGEVARLVGDNGQARDHYTQGLTVARQLGYRRGMSDALSGLGDIERVVANYDQARQYHTDALALARQLGYPRGEVHALRGLGDVGRVEGKYDSASEYYIQALTLARHLGYCRAEAQTQWWLGHLAIDTARRSQAREFWRNALEVYEKLNIPFAETVRATLSQLDR